MFALTLSGKWGYLEHEWTATAGDFIFETPGESHTLVTEHPEGVKLFGSSFPATLDIETHLDEDVPPVMLDPVHLDQILLNLCQNAVKFTENGEVSLNVERGSSADSGDDTVRFQVSDTGVGIAPRDLQRLFRPFSQLEDVPTRRHRGTGLGLYISRRLATLLGGRIEVKSRPGAGSVFTLVLPAGNEHR